MGVIRRTPTSLRDYGQIWDYVASQNVAAADALLRELDEKVRLLSDFPVPGRPRLGRAGISQELDRRRGP